MGSITEKLKLFGELSKDKKYKKVLSMLEIIKEDSDFFGDFYNLLISIENEASDELLESIYSILISAIIASEQEEKEENILKLSKTSKNLKKLRELEERQKQEENPDKLLEEIL